MLRNITVIFAHILSVKYSSTNIYLSGVARASRLPLATAAKTPTRHHRDAAPPLRTITKARVAHSETQIKPEDHPINGTTKEGHKFKLSVITLTEVRSVFSMDLS